MNGVVIEHAVRETAAFMGPPIRGLPRNSCQLAFPRSRKTEHWQALHQSQPAWYDGPPVPLTLYRSS